MRRASVGWVLLLAAACGSSSKQGADGGLDSGSGANDGPGGSDVGGPDGGRHSDAGHPMEASLVDAPTIPPALACALPFAPVDTSKPTTVVGSGGAACDEAAVSLSVKKGGIVTFDCGASSTITLTAPLVPPGGMNTTIDGGGKITLDGGGKSRLLTFNGGGYRTTTSVITLQNLTFQNGYGTGTPIPKAPPPCSAGYMTDAGGGAVYVVDSVLRVFDSTFTGNVGQTPGPDVAGGAIYVDGSLGTTIIGSRFANNTCSNGGAIGSLNSDLAVYTTTMSGNSATGTGQNTTSPKCATTSQEIGDGGSGGAIYMDGGHEGDVTFCGDVFEKNHANALGGAFFRVFDDAMHTVHLDVSTIDGDVADGPVGTSGAGPGGGALYIENALLDFNDSTISNNSSPGCGGVQTDESTVQFTNVTVSGNTATDGVGGGMCVFSNGGTLTNCTLANNRALGGTSYSDYYGAAIFGGNLTLNNTILADNTTMNSEGRMTCAATEAGDHDVQWPMNKVVGGSGDTPCLPGVDFVDPMMGALANHGGPTLTQAPGAAASVVQVGTGCPKTDQTGKPRKTPCTIGALEE